MTLSGKVSLKVKMTILIIEILIIGSYGVVVGDKNMGAIRNDAIASMEEYVSEEHPEYSQEEIQQELQPILQKMQQEKKAKQDQFFYFMVIMCILTDIWVLYLTFDITSGVKRSALFAKKMGQGDFTQRVEEKYLKREDEIGILARSIRDIHHNMRHLIGHVQRERIHWMKRLEQQRRHWQNLRTRSTVYPVSRRNLQPEIRRPQQLHRK